MYWSTSLLIPSLSGITLYDPLIGFYFLSFVLFSVLYSSFSLSLHIPRFLLVCVFFYHYFLFLCPSFLSLQLTRFLFFFSSFSPSSFSYFPSLFPLLLPSFLHSTSQSSSFSFSLLYSPPLSTILSSCVYSFSSSFSSCSRSLDSISFSSLPFLLHPHAFTFSWSGNISSFFLFSSSLFH